MDCFAEPVIRRRFAPTGWLAMTDDADHLASAANTVSSGHNAFQRAAFAA
jgi:hypothetical protein